MLILTLSLFASASDCSEPVTPDQLESLADEATLAWAAMDQDGFEELADQTLAGVECLSEPVEPSQAASIHALRALRAFLAGDADAANLHLQAAYASDADFRISTRIAPEGGKLWRLAEQAREIPPSSGRALSLLDGGTVWVDGHAGGDRAEDRPALVQVGAGDRTTWSSLLEPDEPFEPPADALAALPTDLPDTPNTPRPPRSGGGAKGLWYAAGGTGVVAAGLFGASAALRGRYDVDPSQGLHDATNGTFIASTGMAAVTGGLLTAAIVKSRRTSR